MYRQAQISSKALELPQVLYNKEELEEIITELPISVEIHEQIKNYLNTLDAKTADIQRYQAKKNPADFYEAMRTALLEIRNIASALYELTKAFHPSFPNTLKQKILKWIEPLEKELSKRLEMPVDDREALEHKTKHLYAEQSLVSREPELQRSLMQHLVNLKQILQPDSGMPAPRCYISYAWPSKEHKESEYWVQPFLWILYDHLKAAGIRVVMDIRDNNPGDSIYRFMQQYHDGNYTILVGTESLLQKHYSPKAHAVQTELSIILDRFEQDQKQFGQSRIYPMLISGTMKTAYPERYQLYSTVRDAREQGYLGVIKKLIDWLFEVRLPTIQSEYLNLWHTFYSACPGLPKDNLMRIKEEIDLNYHRQRLDFLRQDVQYQSVQAQQETKHSPAVTAEMISVLMQAQTLTPRTLFDEHGQQFQRPFNNPDFIERPILAKKIKQHFSSSESQILTLTTHGLGGMGKTELAQHYYLHPPKPYELRVWFHVKAGRESLYQQYLDLASSNGLRFHEELKIEEKVTLVKRWLEQQKDCLLVYDDVENAKILEGLLPEQGKHHILITSRNEVDWINQTLDIDVMEEQEAIALIVKIIKRTESEDKLKLLIKTLGRLPLALAQAGAYMSVKSLNIDDYLALYHQYQEKLLKEETRRSLKHEPIWVTFDMNFQALSQECPIALILLKQVSWMSSPIPDMLLKAMLEIGKDYCDHHETSDLLWGDVTEKIRCYSLLKFDLVQQQASIHPLLQDILRSKQEEEEWLELRTGLCSMLDLWIIENDSRDAALDRMLLPHAEALYQYCGSLITNLLKTNNPLEAEKYYELIPRGLGKIYSDLGFEKKSLDFLQKQLSVAILCYGEDSINVADIQSNLATILFQLGDYVTAKAICEKALATLIECYQTESHVSVASTQQNLAGILEKLGDYTAAKALCEKVLATNIAHYQTEAHENVAQAQHILAHILERLGDYVEAKTLCKKALATTIAYYQAEAHVSVADIQQNLAVILGRLGDYEAAKALHEKALATKIAHYQTEAHVRVAEAQQDLALILERLHDYTAAKALHEKALTVKIAYYQTENHVKVADIQHNLAHILVILGDYTSAKILYEKVLETTIMHYQTKNHVQVAVTQHSLADIFLRLKNYESAKALYEKALATKISHYKTEVHLEVAKTQCALASLLPFIGNFFHAYSLINKCEKTFQTQPGGAQYLKACRQVKKIIESQQAELNVGKLETVSVNAKLYQNMLFYNSPVPDQAIRNTTGNDYHANPR